LVTMSSVILYMAAKDAPIVKIGIDVMMNKMLSNIKSQNFDKKRIIGLSGLKN